MVPPLARRCALIEIARERAEQGSSARAEMRPRRRAVPKRKRGFLRSRGDAPQRSSETRRHRGVPPLARRCAARLRRPREREGGSSARAEMRPRVRCCTAPRGGFLRSRGDAPGFADSLRDAMWVPPLARRCALQPQADCARCLGSSARAEMRLYDGLPTEDDIRFLRSRGDAPIFDLDAFGSPWVPPLARRCASVADRVSART